MTDYQNLTMNLYQLYHGTERSSSSRTGEGDNAVYCSGAYAYATDSSFRAACDANFPVLYKGVPNPATALSGFARWLQARRQGIQAGTSWAVANGFASGVSVSFAIEFNIVSSLKQPSCTVSFNSSTCLSTLNCAPNANACQPGTYPNVLCDVIPTVGFVYVSYSAYESTNVSSTQLTSDPQPIRNALGTSNVLIGEVRLQPGGLVRDGAERPPADRQRPQRRAQLGRALHLPVGDVRQQPVRRLQLRRPAAGHGLLLPDPFRRRHVSLGTCN